MAQFVVQKEEESRTPFHEELDQQLSGRTLSPELLEANKIIANRDRDIEDLKKDRDEMLKEYLTWDLILTLQLMAEKSSYVKYVCGQPDITTATLQTKPSQDSVRTS